jgi:hypothetical protein
MESTPGLDYALCVITCLAAVFNLVTFLVKLKPRKISIGSTCYSPTAMIGCGIFADAFYCCLAAALLVLIINVYINGDGVLGIAGYVTKPQQCLVGGFFTLFGVTESLFLLAERSILLAHWLKSSSTEGSTYSDSGNQSCNTADAQSSRKRNETAVKSEERTDVKVSSTGGQQTGRSSKSVVKQTIAYWVFQIVQMLIWSVLCFIPLVSDALMASVSNADLNVTQSYFGCVPLTVNSEAGTSLAAWRYSCFLLVVLAWCPVILAVVCCVVIIVSLCKQSVDDSQTAESYELSASRRQLIMFIQTVVEEILWITVVIVASVAFFGDGRTSNKVTMQWILGYLLSIVLLWHSVMETVILLVDWRQSSSITSGKRYQGNSRQLCPHNIAVVSEVPAYNCTHQQV